ncbi:hypothetical protein KTO58_06855 [Chitinophaga pendula]|uniref:hypothetical protein n=1 Tax=Chitinophaga TaxID=79328 RepID=UPI000BAEA5B2|nr:MULTISPECIES: hypothetical protein [Chitinophaga]ASZ13475.1 hypothetical protein CK934_22200 [Chitinophaga sp. MD30]UCJ08898.1 hypothetical protein KTO58_06855 [Chitinophaga pendula]
MKKLLLSAVIAAAAMSCSRNKTIDTPAAPESSFTLNDQKFSTPFANLDGWGDAMGDLSISSVPMPFNVSGSKINVIDIEVDTLIDGQTYTYLSPQDNYDRKKYFSNASVAYDATFKDGDIDPANSKIVRNVKSGTLKVSKKNDEYTIEYYIEFVKGEIARGYYRGQVSFR